METVENVTVKHVYWNKTTVNLFSNFVSQSK
jgi:hypothetical protein